MATGRTPAPPIDAGEGVWIFQSPLWQTNAALIERGGDVLLCDPAFYEPEIEAIRGEVERRTERAPVLLVTHADFDHTCGIPWFPAAQVLAAPDTAEVIRSGAAAESLTASGPDYGVHWRADLRVDHVLEPGATTKVGPWTVETIAAPSHGREGAAFAVLGAGVLLAGDHLSAITIPLLVGLASAIEANRRLLDAFERLDLRLVVPGHGRAHMPDEARRIGEADLAYLEGIAAAAREAVTDGLPPNDALLHVYAVEPPRGDTPDFAVYGIRAANARVALDEAAAAG
jgi:glyoxylase-like metal-dependent hydrolase (beta-lactamase superfamily II)